LHKVVSVIWIGAALILIEFSQAKSKFINPVQFPSGWIIQADSISDGFNDIEALDTLTAWVVGALNSKPVVFHTTDGGLQWLQQSATSLSDWQATGVSFPDKRHGWVVGTSEFYYLTTLDGGQSWQELIYPNRFRAIQVHFVDSLTGWIVGHLDTILYTSDGGQNWSKQVVGNYRGNLLDVHFVNSLYGWVAGGNASPDNSSLILKTTDGGSTWQRFPGLFSPSHVAVDLLGTSNAWFSGFVGGFIFTSDGGATWEDTTLPGAGNNNYTGISFIDPLRGWVVGTGGFLRGEILRTIDGGHSWSFEVKDSLVPLRRIAMLDDRHGWAVGEYGLILKYDPPVVLGDLNLDSQITSADIVLELNRVFLGQAFLSPELSGDVNCDSAFSPADVVLLLLRVFVQSDFPCTR